jgi:hypothetical protein
VGGSVTATGVKAAATATLVLSGTGQTPPVAVNDSYTVNENASLIVGAPGVLGNDSDPDGDTIQASSAFSPVNGSVTITPDGSFAFTPTQGFYGTGSFSYTDVDSHGAVSNVATVTITVVPSPPVANDDHYVTSENTPISDNVLANDTDPNNLQLSAVLLSPAANGSVTLNADGSFVYTPNTGFFGVDSFIYRAHDTASAVSNVAAVTINVTPTPPVAVNDSYTATENTPLTVSAPGVLANDTGANLPLTAVLVSGPTHGTLTLSSDGSFTYTPSFGFFGTDSFTYQATDTDALVSNVATVTITVNPLPPVAFNQSFDFTENTQRTLPADALLGSAYDPNFLLPLTVVRVSGPANGTLTFHFDGSFTYTPNQNFLGTDSFTYQAKNTAGVLSNVATVTITVVLPSKPLCESDGGTYAVGTGGTVWTCDGLPDLGDFNAEVTRVAALGTDCSTDGGTHVQNLTVGSFPENLACDY